MALGIYTVDAQRLKPSAKFARCAGRVEKCTMYKQWDWRSCKCINRDICDMNCGDGFALDPSKQCECTDLSKKIPANFQRQTTDAMGQCGSGWYWSDEANTCVSENWCPSAECPRGMKWDQYACGCSEILGLGDEDEALTQRELDNQCGSGYNWDASVGTCVEASQGAGVEVQVERQGGPWPQATDDEDSFQVDYESFQENISCPQEWEWDPESEQCQPPSVDLDENPSTFSYEEELVCPIGWLPNAQGTQCTRRCAVGQEYVESRSGSKCEWINDVKCIMRRECSLGRYQGIRDGKCVCLKIKNFQPGNQCGAEATWNWRKWRCVKSAPRCPASKTCSYGKKWDATRCTCVREDWCPAETMCSYGKYWNNERCKCLRLQWCPEKKACPDRLNERWDNRQCSCIAIDSFQCPNGMSWNNQKEECRYSQEGCQFAECPAEKKPMWFAGDCRCRYRSEYCNRLECPLGKEAKWSRSQCRCVRIPNYRPPPGTCGSGKRWSLRAYTCKTFKGCGPGRNWSDTEYKCVGTLACPEGTKWSGRRGKCLTFNPKCEGVKRRKCPKAWKWSWSSCKCIRSASCPKTYTCSSPLMAWDNQKCKCVAGRIDGGISTCPHPLQIRHRITKTCICVHKSACKWNEKWDNATCECKRNDERAMREARRRMIRTAQLEMLKKRLYDRQQAGDDN